MVASDERITHLLDHRMIVLCIGIDDDSGLHGLHCNSYLPAIKARRRKLPRARSKVREGNITTAFGETRNEGMRPMSGEDFYT